MDFRGKTGLIMGVANDRSIATGIAQHLAAAGAQMAFNFLPDAAGKMERRAKKALQNIDALMIEPCDVNDDGQLDVFFTKVQASCERLDFLVHAIAYAPLQDIRCATVDVSREGFLQAMETSVYSFMACARRASQLMQGGASIVTLSYYGAERVVPGYNLMGVAKAALESATRYLAFDLGHSATRVNAISAGPLKTLAASAIGDFGKMLKLNAASNPLGRNITAADIAKTTAFLLSDDASAVTGEIIHVDCGYNIMGCVAESAV